MSLQPWEIMRLEIDASEEVEVVEVTEETVTTEIGRVTIVENNMTAARVEVD